MTSTFCLWAAVLLATLGVSVGACTVAHDSKAGKRAREPGKAVDGCPRGAGPGAGDTGDPSSEDGAADPYQNHYVDCSATSDGDGSESSPWSNLKGVNSFTFQPYHRLLFKRGTKCTGTFEPQGSGSSEGPVLVDAYGEGARPIIAGGGADDAIKLYNQEYWELRTLEVTNDAVEPENRRGIYIEIENYGVADHIVLNDLYVHDVKGDQTKDAYAAAGIFLEVVGLEDPSKFNDVVIENCTIETVDRTGIRSWSSYGGEPTTVPWASDLPEGKITDRPLASEPWSTGWTNIVIRNNRLCDIGGDGIVAIHMDGALVEGNVLTGANIRSGTYSAGIWAWDSNNTTFQFNEVSDVRTTMDGQAYDVDYNQDNTIVQYNYSHDNEGGFILLMAQSDRTATVRYNLSVNDRRDEAFHFNSLTDDDHQGDMKIYNNTVYIGPAADGAGIGNANSPGVQMYNNLFYNANEPVRFECGASCGNNMFWGVDAAPSAGLSADPLFIGAGGPSPIGRANAAGYQVQPSSPTLGAGRIMANSGGTNFWGGELPTAEQPNIGAH